MEDELSRITMIFKTTVKLGCGASQMSTRIHRANFYLT